MKAAVYYGKNDIRVEEVARPTNKPNNIIVKILCCAICGTDLKTYMMGSSKITPPKIIGHEMVGSIVHVGEDVSGFSPGEYVTLATTISCGVCNYCKAGLGNLCINTTPISSYYDGAFADYIEIPPKAIENGNVVKVPSSSEYRNYALCEPLSCAVNAHEISRVKENDVVAIIGGGPLGAIHAELAKAEGAKKVYVIEISQQRLALMQRLKGVELIDSSSVDVAQRLREDTDGTGADVVMVCAPAAAAMEDALKYVKKGGTVCYFASLPAQSSQLSIDSRDIHYNELRVVGSSDSRQEHVEKAVSLIRSGKIDCDAIITHAVRLSNIIDGFELMKVRESLKVLVYPEEITK